MVDAFETDNCASGLRPPELAPPPRAVPLVIQWQLLENSIIILIGSVFVLASLLFLILPQFADGNRLEGPWRFFPLIHLVVGLGIIIVPLVIWRRRVAILKLGFLAHARIVALQNQVTVRSASEEPYGGRNVDGPWVDFEIGLAQARSFWANTLPAALPGSINPASTIIKGFGCILMFFGGFAVLFFAVGLGFLWIGGKQPVGEKAMWTLIGLAFLAVYLGAIWFIKRGTSRMEHFASGKLSIGQLGIPTTVRCCFIYSTLEGVEKDATTYIDLRQRFRAGQADPADLVVYLPNDPRRALLLGGLWPPIWVQNGEWVRAD